MKKIAILSENISVTAELKETETAEKIWNALPFEAEVNTWGDEIYFEIPVKISLESDASADVEIGDLGYWPAGSAFCIFFGPTPVSKNEKPRAASPVNVFGLVSGNTEIFRNIYDGALIRVEKL